MTSIVISFSAPTIDKISVEFGAQNLCDNEVDS
jgi:hypothetical protein